MTDLTDAQRNFITQYIAQISAAPAAPNPWTKFRAGLEKRVLSALKAQHPEAEKIRGSWALAQEKAEAGDFAAAMNIATRLDALIAGARDPSVPVGTVAFQRSRLLWIAAKADMKKGIDTFSAAVLQQAADDEEKDLVVSVMDELVGEFDVFDQRLEDQLDDITNTPEGPDRTRLKKDAQKTLADYMAALSGPFFSSIDNNPFVPVKVAARGQQSLSTISATLS